MRLPNVPSLWWSIPAFYVLLFLVSAKIGSATSHEPGILGLLQAGLFLPLAGAVGFVAPFVLWSWVSWLITLAVIAGLILAGLKLTGWARWIAVMALIICMNGYGMYLMFTVDT